MSLPRVKLHHFQCSEESYCVWRKKYFSVFWTGELIKATKSKSFWGENFRANPNESKANAARKSLTVLVFSGLWACETSLSHWIVFGASLQWTRHMNKLASKHTNKQLSLLHSWKFHTGTLASRNRSAFSKTWDSLLWEACGENGDHWGYSGWSGIVSFLDIK